MNILFIFIDPSPKPMHWSIAGLIIGAIVPALLLYGNKNFGVSSTLRHICTLALPNDKGFFDYDLKPHWWSIIFIIGIGIGGFFSHIIQPGVTLELGPKTQEALNNYNLENTGGLYPSTLYNFENMKGLVLLVLGGILIGFGTRYANGCTSGHSIFGIANFQLSSLIATISFFVGGLAMTHFILPIIL